MLGKVLRTAIHCRISNGNSGEKPDLAKHVGLGKTFVGLMLIERLILHDSKRVVLFAPKAAKEAVWEPHLQDWRGGGTQG